MQNTGVGLASVVNKTPTLWVAQSAHSLPGWLNLHRLPRDNGRLDNHDARLILIISFHLAL